MKTATRHQAGNRNHRMLGRCVRLTFTVLGIALLLPPQTSAGSSEPEFRWAVQLNSAPDPTANHHGGYAIAVDGAGNSYVTGNFQGIAIFGNHTLTNHPDVSDLFVAKLGHPGAGIALCAGVTVEGVEGKTNAIQTATDRLMEALLKRAAHFRVARQPTREEMNAR